MRLPWRKKARGNREVALSFEETVNTLRGLIGKSIGINIGLREYGPASGYVADMHGVLARVDEPHPGVDEPVYYFRFQDGSGFSVHEDRFRDAAWHTVARQRSLEINLARVTLDISAD